MKLIPSVPGRIDWPSLRPTIDLAAVATNLLGPPPGRRGEHGRRLWWSCPFHEDRNPSFAVDPGKSCWKCWGCRASGDAAALVMKVRGVTFPEAVRHLAGDALPSPTRKAPTRPAKPLAPPPPEPTGLPEADAVALVEAAAARLWSVERSDALTHLRNTRCLSDETIRRARLGWCDGASIPTRDGDRAFRASGIVVPWFVGDQLVLVKIRQPPGRKPKYAEAYRDASRVACYPSPATVRPGRPLVVTEGELDALALGEALGDAASVVTLGSASARLDPGIVARCLLASPWFVTHDADPAGDRAAEAWPARARRVRPPEPHKDWTEAKAAGVNLARWWSDIFRGIERPQLFTWEDLKARRWGPALDESPGPGLDCERDWTGSSNHAQLWGSGTGDATTSPAPLSAP